MECDSSGGGLNNAQKLKQENRRDALDRCYRSVQMWHEFGETVRDFIEEIELNESITSEKIAIFALCMEKLGEKVDKVADLMGQIKRAVKNKKFTSE